MSLLFDSSEYFGVYLFPLLIYLPIQLSLAPIPVSLLSWKVSRYERERAIAGRHREEEENDNDGNGTDKMKDSQILMQSKMTVDEEDGAGSGGTGGY